MENPIRRYVEGRKKVDPSYTYAQLAEAMGYSVQYVSDVANDRTPASADFSLAASRATGGRIAIEDMVRWGRAS